MSRLIAFAYGLIAYAIFLLTFLYAIGFVGNIIVPKSIDSGPQGPLSAAIVINLLLLSLFALQHSIMARPAFKRVWTKLIPKAVERSTYVLTSCGALIMIFGFWHPMTGVIWDAHETMAAPLLISLFWLGWGIVLASTFMIDHLDLVGLKQVHANLKKRVPQPNAFRKFGFYQLVRHPIMTGFLIAFWATPLMTTGHLLFAVVTTGYIIIAVLRLEEKDLIAEIGAPYVDYQREIPAFVPRLKGRTMK